MTAATVAQNGQRLTEQEIAQARKLIEQTLNGVIGATKRLSDAQWRFKPSPEEWSVAENLDHMVIVQGRVLDGILTRLADAPAAPAGRDNQVIDAMVIHQIPTRLDKFKAPEVVAPVGEIVPDEKLEQLKANCKRLSERLEGSGLREHAVEAPPLRAISKGAYDLMDGYQWILAAAAHTERHTKQVLEVMANPGFPV